MPDGTDRARLLELFGSRSANERQKAIADALDQPDADQLLATMFEASSDCYDRCVIVAHLGDIQGDSGTSTLRAAAQATGAGARDLRCTALLALAKRCGETATPWLRDALKFPNGDVKDYAVIGLAGAGNGEAWDEVAARLAVLVRKNLESSGDESPALFAVAYLGQHVQHEVERRASLVSLVRRHWSKRSVEEIRWFGTYWPTSRPGGPSAEDVGAPDAHALRIWARAPLFNSLDPPTIL